MRYSFDSHSIDRVAVGGKYPGGGQAIIHSNGGARPDDPLQSRVDAVWERIETARNEELYYYLQPVDELDGAWVNTQGASGSGRKLMFATYSYLGLLRHPRV